MKIAEVLVYYFFSFLINLPYLLAFAISFALIIYLIFRKEKILKYLFIFLIPFLMIELLPFGNLIVGHLENKIKKPTLPEEISGIILLGGSISGPLTRERGEAVQNMAGTRLYEFIELAMRYPKAKLLITGTPMESDFALLTLKNFGISSDRIIVENKSRNTQDNAHNSYHLVNPQENDSWVLVTSAFHLYRSSLVFQKSGWKVIPYPVNYLTSGVINLQKFMPSGLNILSWHVGFKEYAGIISNALFF